MSTHIDAIITRLKVNGWEVFDTEPPVGHDSLRLIVIAPELRRDRSAMRSDGALTDYFQIKGAGRTPGECRRAMAHAADRLDGRAWTITGYRIQTIRRDAGFLYADRELILPATNTQMVAAVDFYQYSAAPNL